MNTTGRTGLQIRLALLALLASLGGCTAVGMVASTVGAVGGAVGNAVGSVAAHVAHPFTSTPASAPAPAGLDDYKTRVARHVSSRNPEHIYSGTLPPLLPAIVVLEITVDQDGRMTGVEVQRARDAHAAQVALASMRRSAPLPPPQRLAEAGPLKFSETFLFADADRFQLRSLASPQASE